MSDKMNDRPVLSCRIPDARATGSTTFETYSPGPGGKVDRRVHSIPSPALEAHSEKEEMLEDSSLLSADRDALRGKIDIAVNLSLTANVLLCLIKLYAVIISHSLAVLASLMDSLLDLVSQIVLYFTERNIRRPIDCEYPAGRTRLEPVGVIICSALMGMASIEVIKESITTFIEALQGTMPVLDMTPFTIGVLVGAIAVKLALFMFCVSLKDVSGSAMTLAEDHRNDVLSNGVALLTSTVAHFNTPLWWVDPLGAMIISLYIMVNWYGIAQEQISFIVGKAADPEVLERIHALAKDHHPLMTPDIVRAYHFGRNFLVEIEMVAPRDMVVEQAHDIGLALQQKVEAYEFVERAFVHIDYDWRDYNEHKDPATPLGSTASQNNSAWEDGGGEGGAGDYGSVNL